MGKSVSMTSAGRDTSVLRVCSCINAYQDKRYGEGKRVHNWGEKLRLFRCVVCKATRG